MSLALSPDMMRQIQELAQPRPRPKIYSTRLLKSVDRNYRFGEDLFVSPKAIEKLKTEVPFAKTEKRSHLTVHSFGVEILDAELRCVQGYEGYKVPGEPASEKAFEDTDMLFGLLIRIATEEYGRSGPEILGDLLLCVKSQHNVDSST